MLHDPSLSVARDDSAAPHQYNGTDIVSGQMGILTTHIKVSLAVARSPLRTQSRRDLVPLVHNLHQQTIKGTAVEIFHQRLHLPRYRQRHGCPLESGYDPRDGPASRCDAGTTCTDQREE